MDDTSPPPETGADVAERWAATPAREHLEAALAELEAQGMLTLHGGGAARTVAVTLLCERMHQAQLLRDAAARPAAGTRAGFAAFLEEVARGAVDDAAWQAEAGVPHADASVEEARRQAGFTRLRLRQGSITTEQAAGYFRTLAQRLREGGG